MYPKPVHTRQTHKHSPDKWHINSTFTQHVKQCIQEKADRVQNQNLDEMCLDWTQTHTFLVGKQAEGGLRSYPERVQCYKIWFIFPSASPGTVLTTISPRNENNIYPQTVTTTLRTLCGCRKNIQRDRRDRASITTARPAPWTRRQKIKTLVWRLRVIPGGRGNKSF